MCLCDQCLRQNFFVWEIHVSHNPHRLGWTNVTQCRLYMSHCIFLKESYAVVSDNDRPMPLTSFTGHEGHVPTRKMELLWCIGTILARYFLTPPMAYGCQWESNSGSPDKSPVLATGPRLLLVCNWLVG